MRKELAGKLVGYVAASLTTMFLAICTVEYSHKDKPMPIGLPIGLTFLAGLGIGIQVKPKWIGAVFIKEDEQG